VSAATGYVSADYLQRTAARCREAILIFSRAYPEDKI